VIIIPFSNFNGEIVVALIEDSVMIKNFIMKMAIFVCSQRTIILIRLS